MYIDVVQLSLWPAGREQEVEPGNEQSARSHFKLKFGCLFV